MDKFDYFINFSKFDQFEPFFDINSLVTSQKKSSSSSKYIFRLFDFNCNSSSSQKIILDTFFRINQPKSPYLQTYSHLSLTYQSKFTPTFSMKFISSKTIEKVIQTPELKSFNINDVIRCIFSVSAALLRLHENLVCHGNLCPSNIIIDEEKRFYVSDFGLYPIKSLYIEDKYLFNNNYKDPFMINNSPEFVNDVYSFGVLMCELFLTLQSDNENNSNKINMKKTLHEFIIDDDQSKFDSFPHFFAELIPKCLCSDVNQRPTFKQIIEMFETTEDEISGVKISKLYYEFNNLSFQDIPNQLESLINKIQDPMLMKIYNEFKYRYLSLVFRENNENQDKSNFESFLFNYLKDFKFIVYHFCNSNENVFSDAIICIEKECIIIENANIESINKIMEKLKNIDYYVLNVSHKNYGNQTDDEKFAKEEIKYFQAKFTGKIMTNKFIFKTINSIIGYMIRRYYCRSCYFNDQSFFFFDQSKINESQIKSKLSKLIFSNDKKLVPTDLKQIIKEVNLNNRFNNDNNIYEFNKNDFVSLRDIFVGTYAKFTLVIHKETLYVFVMKTPYPQAPKINNEIYFCEIIRHRCLNRFYGFLKEKEKITGFIYEFMSNGNLKSFLCSNNKVNDINLLMIFCRIQQGIEYLHSQKFIHRDLKPENILIDHDYMIYISDFETVLKLDEDSSFTYSFASANYSSPEQDQGRPLSYSTDIYSFGLIIYFIFKKYDLVQKEGLYKKQANDQIPQIENISKNLQNIFENCIKYSPKERLTYDQVKQEIINETNSFDYIEKYLLNNDNVQTQIEINDFFYENFNMQCKNQEQLKKCCKNIYCFSKLYLCKMQKGHSAFLNKFGTLYLRGFNVEQNYVKAKEFFELSAKENNIKALINLGNLYVKGLGVQQDYSRAKEYYELAANQNDPNGFIMLGNLYLNGFGVQQDYSRAKEYYELAAKNNNSYALLKLGDLYFNGAGVQQDYLIAKKYYELASEQSNSQALNNLGDLYRNGFGVEKNIIKAKELYEMATRLKNLNALNNLGELYFDEHDYLNAKKYFELAAKQNNSDALNNLGIIYLGGYGIDKDIIKAIEYFELSAQQNNPNALYNLGNLYQCGIGVKQDILIAKDYYEQASEQGNSKALNCLGDFYLLGICVTKDLRKAREYYEQSAKDNNADAFDNLGGIYYYGIGIEKDIKKSIEYYELAAQQNKLHALIVLGDLYFEGKEIKQDYSKSKGYYEKASEQDYNVLNKLGDFYYYGHGVEQNYLKAKEYYELALQHNSTEAMVNLGNLYYEGYGVKQNYLKAKEYFEMAAKKNNPRALYILGVLFRNGNGVEQNYLKAKEYFELAIKQKNTDAYIQLGFFYQFGYGVEQNYLKAKEYYELASENNCVEAFNYLGDLYFHGLGVEQDYLKAKEYYENGVQHNDPSALYSLGVMYEQGYGVDQNFKKAKVCYELASKQNNLDSYYGLGSLYFNGRGVKQDYLKAKECYEVAAKQNHSNSLNALGDLYINGHGVNQDYLKAREYYELAANQNNSDAFLNLGFIYCNGLGVNQNYSKAKENFELAAKLDESYGYLYLGILYHYGYGVVRDYNKEQYYYEKAINLNNSQAMLNMGLMYENGDGVNKDYSQAIHYYELASNLNNSYALLSLGFLYEKGLGVKKDYIIAKQYYEKSSNLNNSDAYMSLGLLYENGLGVDRDINQARKCFEYAAQLNNFEAFHYLGKFYSDGNFLPVNIPRSIEFYTKSIQSQYLKVSPFNFLIGHFSWSWLHRTLCHISSNDLGLIYITVFQDKDKANVHLKESAFAEFPFGQNNFGLLNQFFYKNKENDAEYMYKRASEHNFALAEYNLGYMKEKAGNIEQSIDYYIRASNDEDHPLIFHRKSFYDERYEISKTFIICFTNLKLSSYFLKNSNNEEAKKYFIKAFLKINSKDENLDYKFQFHFDNKKVLKDIFTYLKFFIFSFPSFNLRNQKNLSQLNNNKKDIESHKSKRNESSSKVISYYDINHEKTSKIIFDEENDINDVQNEIDFNDTGELFDFLTDKNKFKNIFIDELNEIIQMMHRILYTHPYPILFGRISIERTDANTKSKAITKDINGTFYEGLGIE